ncbi:putative 2-aminoethylphosphonate ABC transporter substrate-binding protein [Domibacillus sp. DTU_2020_1001157_1_SI_ALB_TIR_016]|uniref:putative 2-aminoethylphosphonate ABC transporter substrate-binding protein n=1 Tax=Domibacillus sp. DTU_2020_1001157_1_SI_ALB_TIR_016 TaxID=3077789 RepID=UPI0028E8BD00|nr:putative 2-aminoethylphosphonate ABC transporter substrate-binding protein [Domibacillus sp. DTU_2020_1001157_1_SI_ALB_TIR_016]WNS78479.1 putative 2-aminoethylphosphonate ABC transporter substrate-binding protein [Domibacillus sp. DTU_2020_1001157_1_SI_ALB_TIR_016]
MKRIAWSLLVSSTLFISACSNEKSAPAEAQSGVSGELTVYTAIEEEVLPVYLESFEQKYPKVDVNIVRDSTGIMTAKLLAEGKNTSADVVWGIAASSLLALDQKGMLAGYTPKGADNIKDAYKDQNEPMKWTGNTAAMTGIAVNTAELEKLGLPIPKTYEDLLDPRYKGLIVMPHPASSGTGYLTVNAWLQMMGKEKGWNYMDRLHENIGTYTHSGSKPAKMAAAGEYPIGLSIVYTAVQMKEEGAPVEVVLPEEGLGWDVEANAMIQKEDKESDEAAKAFLNWAIEKNVMKKYFDANGFTTLNEDFTLPASFPSDIEKHMYPENDLYWAAENRDAILSEWESKYGTKAEPKE